MYRYRYINIDMDIDVYIFQIYKHMNPIEQLQASRFNHTNKPKLFEEWKFFYVCRKCRQQYSLTAQGSVSQVIAQPW